MTLQLQIPESVAQAIRLPEKRLEDDLLLELAVALYAQEALSFGKARELAGMSKYEFGRLLGKRQIARHYGPEELDDDIRYAHAGSDEPPAIDTDPVSEYTQTCRPHTEIGRN